MHLTASANYYYGLAWDFTQRAQRTCSVQPDPTGRHQPPSLAPGKPVKKTGRCSSSKTLWTDRLALRTSYLGPINVPDAKFSFTHWHMLPILTRMRSICAYSNSCHLASRQPSAAPGLMNCQRCHRIQPSPARMLKCSRCSCWVSESLGAEITKETTALNCYIMFSSA
jgi:hypothetical protein